MTLLEALLKIREALPLLQDGIPCDGVMPHLGICHNVCRLIDGGRGCESHLERLGGLLLKWPKRSKGSTGKVFPVGGYNEYFREGDRKYQNPKRIALLNWLIEELQK